MGWSTEEVFPAEASIYYVPKRLASYSMDTAVFLLGIRRRGKKLTTHAYLEPSLRISGAITLFLLPLTPSWCV